MNFISGWYLSPTSNISIKYRKTFGQIESLADIHPTALIESPVWALDNSVFTGKFKLPIWVEQLEKLRVYREKCLFVTLPDVVGNFPETLIQFRDHRDLVKGFPRALVSQDGFMNNIDAVPWGDFDALFVGGSNLHKLGSDGARAILEARKRKKWIHVGRVNSVSRLLRFWQADSWDGTTLTYEPGKVVILHEAILLARAMKKQRGFFYE